MAIGNALDLSLTTTNHSVLLGGGSNVIGATAALTDGQVVLGVTGGQPVAASLTAGAGISLTPAAGALTIASTGSASVINMQYFSASGTYTPTTGMAYCMIEAVGGGGGSGGCQTTSSIQVAASGGGGGGQYLRGIFSAATIGASQSVTVGAAGAAGTAGNNNGGAGGSSSVGSLIVASGGTGGNGSAATGSAATNAGGGGGSSGTATFAKSGITGQSGVAVYTATAYNVMGGAGGSSFLGAGGPPTMRIAISGGNTVGLTGGLGSGGSGSVNTISCADTAGAVGGAGAVIITEFGSISGLSASGTRVLLATKTAAASSTLDFTGYVSGTYAWYEFWLDGVTSSTSTIIGMRVSTDGGSTFISSGYQEITITGNQSAAGSGNGGTTGSFPILQQSSNTAASTSTYRIVIDSGIVYITNGQSVLSGSATIYEFGGNLTASGVNAFRFLPSSGNFTGTFKLYGILA